MGFWAKFWSGWTRWVDSIHSLTVMTKRAPAVPTMDLIHITIFLTRYPNQFNNLTTGLDMASLHITDRSKILEHCCRHDSRILLLIIYAPEYNWVGWLIPYPDISLSTVEDEEETFFLLTRAPLVIKSSAPSLDLASSLIGKISEVTNCLFSSSLFPDCCLICLVCFQE